MSTVVEDYNFQAIKNVSENAVFTCQSWISYWPMTQKNDIVNENDWIFIYELQGVINWVIQNTEELEIHGWKYKFQKGG